MRNPGAARPRPRIRPDDVCQHAGISRRIPDDERDVGTTLGYGLIEYAARNQDDHVKNIAFLMDKTGRWSLSPAFDVIYSYNPSGSWTSEHQQALVRTRWVHTNRRTD